MKLSEEQKVQESRYEFPYHYIPLFENGDFSQTKNLTWGYEYLSYINFVLNRLDNIDFSSLADVGCGDGRFLLEIYKKFPSKDMTGLDYSGKAIGFARAFCDGINYVVGDITDRHLFDKRFDVITLIEVLEHIPPAQVPIFLDGIDYYLKEKGYLIITVPSDNIRCIAKHYQHFNLESLKTNLSPKFEIIEHCFLNKISVQTSIVHQLLTNKLFILNHQGVRRLIYRYYIKNLLMCNEHGSKRIYALCKKRAK